MSASRSPTYQEGTGYLLAIAGAAARRRWVEMLARFDVTPSQFKVIMSLGELDHLGQRQLAEAVGIDPRNCVPIIDSLVGRNLLASWDRGARERFVKVMPRDYKRVLAEQAAAAEAAAA